MHAYLIAHHEYIGVDLQLQQDWGCNKGIQPAPAAPVGPLPIAPYRDPSAAAQLAPVSAAEATDVQKGLNLYHVLMSARWLMQTMNALQCLPVLLIKFAPYGPDQPFLACTDLVTKLCNWREHDSSPADACQV